MKKNIMPAMFLSLILMINTLCMPAIAEETVQSDAASGLLTDWNIIDEDMDLSAECTRGDFLKLVLKTIKVDLDDSAAENSYFSDVAVTNEYAAYVEYAIEAGYISGRDDDTFRPTRPITKQDAAVILVNIMGFSYFAEQKGGYPYGYLQTAADYGIIDSSSAKDSVSVSEAADIICRFLEAPMLSLNVENPNNVSFEVDEDNTILKNFYNAYIAEGILEAVGYHSIKDENGGTENTVVISGISYEGGITGDTGLLGYNIKAYIDEDNERVIAVLPGRNNVITIDGADIERDSSSITSVAYYEDKSSTKLKRAKISTDADMLYNGQANPAFTLEDLTPEIGSVTLIDNNNDGDYDVVVSEVYDIIFLSYVAQYNKIIYNRYSYPGALTSLDIDNDDGDLILDIHMEGEPVDNIAELAKNDILMVKQSKTGDKKILDIEVIRQGITGTVESFQNSDEGSTVVIDGKEYELSPVYIRARSNADEAAPEIKTGRYGTAYLDKNGYVAAFVYNDLNSEKYGYVRKIYTDENESAYVRLLTTDEEWLTLKFADKISINDGKKISAAEAAESPFLMGPDGAIGQIICYKQNSNDEITKIITAEENSENYDEFRSKTITLTFRPVNSSFASKYYIEPDGKIFVVPVAANGVDKSGDEDLYSVYTGSYFSEATYTVTLYNYDKFGYANMCTYKVPSDQIGNIDPGNYFVCNEIGTGLYEDEPVTILRGIMGVNSSVEVPVSFDCNTDNVQAGEIYKLHLNGKGEVVSLDEVLTVDDLFKKMSNLDPEAVHQSESRLMGIVEDADPENNKLLIDDGNTQTKSIKLKDTLTIVIVDMEKRRDPAVIGKKSDIERGDYVLYVSRWSEPSYMVVYKEGSI